MKIRLNLLMTLITLLIFSLVIFTGCGQKQLGKDSTGGQETNKLPEIVSLATKEIGTRAYGTAVALGDVVTKNTEMELIVEPIGNIGTWAQLMEKGEIEFAQEDSYGVFIKFTGTREYDGEKPATYMRQVLAGYEASLAYLARADSGIEKFTDMAGKTFFTDVPSSPILTTVSDILLEKYGVVNDVNRLKIAKAADAAQQVIEGRASGLTWAVSSVTADMDRSVGIKIIPLTQEDIDDINTSIGSNIVELTIAAPPNYLGMTSKVDVPTYSTRMLLVANKTVSEEAVYTLLEATYSNYDVLKAASPESAKFTLENATKSQVIPFHPGAVKFYKDNGIWTEALEKQQNDLLKLMDKLK